MPNFDYAGKVESKQVIGTETISFTIRLVEPKELQFTAGQFVNIQAGPTLFRPYSIASSPSQPSLLEFAVKLVAGGKASAFFDAMKVGDEVKMKGPFGKFVVNDESTRPDPRSRFIFIASGTGLAPILSQLKTLFEQKNILPKTLYFGFYDSKRYLYKDILEQWEKEHPEFKVIPVVSDEPADSGWTGARGYINPLLEKDITDVTGLDVYVCGNPLMVKAVNPVLLAKGISPEDIHEERF